MPGRGRGRKGGSGCGTACKKRRAERRAAEEKRAREKRAAQKVGRAEAKTMMTTDIPVDQILNPDYVKQCKKPWCWTYVNEMRDEQFPEARKCAGVGDLPAIIYPGNAQENLVGMQEEVTDFYCPPDDSSCEAGDKQMPNLMTYLEKEKALAGAFGQGTDYYDPNMTIYDLTYDKAGFGDSQEAYQKGLQKLKDQQEKKKWENAGFFGTIFWWPKKIFWKTKAFVDGPWYAEEDPESYEYKACHDSFGKTAKCFFTSKQSSILNLRRAVLTWICIITGVSLLCFVGKKLFYISGDNMKYLDNESKSDAREKNLEDVCFTLCKNNEHKTKAVMETVKELNPLHMFLLFAGVVALLAACIGPCVIAIVL